MSTAAESGGAPVAVQVYGRTCLHLFTVSTRRELSGVRAAFMCPECGRERLVSVDWSRYPLPRYCANPGCSTRLNRYNPTTMCHGCQARGARAVAEGST